MDNDDFIAIPANISTVVDLLDTKSIPWAEYQEAIPYQGFQGFNFSNQASFANDYVRKHDPLILFKSVTQNATRLQLIKGFTAFSDDLRNRRLPQWAFITPNMTDDGHDTNITFSVWERDWITPLLNNSYFINNTIALLTLDETESYTEGNKPFAILLGGAILDSLKGTVPQTILSIPVPADRYPVESHTDPTSKTNTFHTPFRNFIETQDCSMHDSSTCHLERQPRLSHYSAMSSVSVNWGLPSLGRWDCNANVFQIVGG
jgi:acid phosphatase